MRPHSMKRRGTGPAISIAALCVSLAATPAWSQAAEFSTDVTARAGYGGSPFLTDESGSAAYLELLVRPMLRFEDARTETMLEAHYRRTEYLSNYGSSYDYGVSAQRSERISERLEMRGSLAFDNSVLGEREAFGLIGPLPENPLNPPEDDIDFDPDLPLTGIGQRRQSIRGAFEGTFSLDESNSLLFGGSIGRTTYPDADELSDFWNSGLNLAYLRTVSPRVSVGGGLSYERIDYDDGEGPFDIFRPEIYYRQQLSPTFRVEAEAGVIIVSGDDSGTSVDVGGNVNACRSGIDSQLCLSLARDASGSGIGGVQITTGVGLSYSRRLTEDDSMTLTGSWNSASTRGENSPDRQYYLASAGYQKALSRRTSLGVSASYRRFDTPERGGADDFGASISLNHRFGSVR